MSITATIAALQERHQSIINVRTADTVWREVVQHGDCPAIVTTPLDGVTIWQSYGGNTSQTTRTYLVRVLVGEFGLGTPEDVFREALAMIDRVIADYRATPAITSTATIAITTPGGVRDAGLRGFGGLPPVTFGGKDYYGTELRIVVEHR